MTNHYKTLGVDKDASQADIKRAYRSLSMEHHPDHNQNDKDSEDKFKEVNEAYSILSNEEKRREYDNPNPFAGLFGSGGFSPFGNMRQKPCKPDFTSPKEGSFLGIEVVIPLKLFIFGGNHTITVPYQESCIGCNGNGFIVGEDKKVCSACKGEGYVQHVQRRAGFQSMHMVPCSKCRGTGLESTERCSECKGTGSVYQPGKEFSFEVPQGSGMGTKIILKNVGRKGVNGGKNGDVGIMIVNIEALDLSKLTDKQVEQLKSILEVRCENKECKK